MPAWTRGNTSLYLLMAKSLQYHVCSDNQGRTRVAVRENQGRECDTKLRSEEQKTGSLGEGRYLEIALFAQFCFHFILFFSLPVTYPRFDRHLYL